MVALAKGRYVARMADTEQDLLAAQRLRQVAFLGDEDGALDQDAFDPIRCTMFLSRNARVGATRLVCCFRILSRFGGWGGNRPQLFRAVLRVERPARL